jgi:hypothetical protein
MLAELSEADATGSIAAIYDEIRTLCAVPYVSSMQRHLATRPGWLDFAWTAIAPAFRSGIAQETGWRLAADLPMDPLPTIPTSALQVWRVDRIGVAAIRGICDGFIRVAPVNMIFAALLKHLLAGEGPDGSVNDAPPWTPPPATPAPPPLVDIAALDDAQRDVLMRFGTDVAGQPFVPGLYRMLAHWPGLLAHLSVVLVPRFTDPATDAASDLLRQRIDDATPDILAQLPVLPATPPMPPAAEHADVLAGLATYRRTSPEMVIFSRLIRDALPD